MPSDRKWRKKKMAKHKHRKLAQENSLATRKEIAEDSENRGRMERIAIGADHAGYALKEEIVRFLQASGYPVEDVGTHGEESVDYPDYAIRVAAQWHTGQAEAGYPGLRGPGSG